MQATQALLFQCNVQWSKFSLSRLLKDCLGNVASHEWSRSRHGKWKEMLIQNNKWTQYKGTCFVTQTLISVQGWIFSLNCELQIGLLNIFSLLLSFYLIPSISPLLATHVLLPSFIIFTFESRSPFHLRTAWNVDSLVMSKTTRAPTASL